MRITRSGKVIDDFYVVGNPGVPVYLMDGDRPALFDAGFTALAPIYERHIKKILGRRTPSYLLSTRARVSPIRDRAHKVGVDPGQHPNTGGHEIIAL
jgi:2-aminobenzoylacetyl-CoA thioesterase